MDDAISHFAYLICLALCALITLPLEVALGARVYSRPGRLLLTIVPVAVLFSLTDVVAIARGLWHYSARYTTGVELPGALPIEEVLFFLVVPVCGLLTYEAVGRVLHRSAVDA